MIEPALQQFIAYPYRKQVVIIITLLTGLVVVWPAVDGYIEARTLKKEASTKLEKTNAEIGKLPRHTELYQKKQEELAALTRRTVQEVSAQRLRNDLVQLVRKAGCTMRRIRLGTASRRNWMENDHPVKGRNTADPGRETPFQLVSRRLSLSITGPMPKLHGFLSEMHKIDKTMHTRSITLQRAGRLKGTATLDLDIVLFDFEKKAES